MRKVILCGIVVASVVSGCGEAKRSLGLARNELDAFAVLDRPPLKMPETYTLVAPKKADDGLEARKTRAQAEATLFRDARHEKAQSETEAALLKGAKTEEADPEIRAQLKAEPEMESVTPRALQEVLFWQNHKAGKVIDPEEEKERLKAIAKTKGTKK